MKKLLLACVLAGLSSATFALDRVPMNQQDIAAKYGKPDKVMSSENEKPRPPMVTKRIEYSKERVRFVLLADAPMGSPPPYKGWLLLGYQDTKDNSVIKAPEVEKRMSSRIKK